MFNFADNQGVLILLLLIQTIRLSLSLNFKNIYDI